MSDAPDADLPGLLGFLAKITGLKRTKDQFAVFVFLGVIAMSIHVAWICGWLVAFGAEVPYAKADDMAKVQASVAALQKNVNISARISLGREIRDQMAVRCHTSDENARSGLSNYIESLQSEYFDLTGQRYPETVCR